MVKKRIVCLANSRMRRTGYKCIAGKDTESGNWIRPVANRPEAGLSWNERRYEDESDPELLDIIEISLVKPYPYYHHSEDWLLDPKSRFKHKSRGAYSDLDCLADNPEELWGGEDVYGDRVEVDRIGKYSHSLYLIKLKGMTLRVSWGKVRGKFSYHNNNYDLVVTDPEVENCIKEPTGKDLSTLEPWQRIFIESRKLYGEYSIGECYVTVSLTANPYKDHYYKLIAAIVTLERSGGEPDD